MEYYVSLRKKKVKIMQFSGSWMELAHMLNEVSQKERNRYRRISFICGTLRYTAR